MLTPIVAVNHGKRRCDCRSFMGANAI